MNTLLSKPFFIGEIFQAFDLHDPSLGPLLTYQFFSVLEAPELDEVLKVQSNKSRLEIHILGSTGHSSFEVQDTADFVGSEHALMSHIQLLMHQDPQVLLSRAAFNPLISQSLLILNIALAQAQNLVLGLVELHEVYMGLLLKSVKVPLGDILFP